MNLRHGIDLVKVSRITKLREKFGNKFLNRCFTEQEITQCEKRNSSDRHFAVRYAAKEAYVKALGTGFDDGIRIKDVEVVTKNGQPTLNTFGRAKEIAEEQNLQQSILSLTHDGDYGSASVILIGE